MDEKHKGRIEESIATLVAELILRRVKDPRVANVSITAVDISRDYSFAKILYTVVGGAPDADTVQRGLESCTPFLRSQIARRMRLRTIPEIAFRYDDSLDRAMRIEELLTEIHREEDERAKEEGEDA